MIKLQTVSETGAANLDTTAKRLRYWRHYALLTSSQLANILGVHRNTIANWETGATEPSISQAALIAKACGCTMGELVKTPIMPQNAAASDVGEAKGIRADSLLTNYDDFAALIEEAEKMQEPRYRINEVFFSFQGEGVRAGTANVFVRFSGCNLACDVQPGPRSPGGFACDTEFTSGKHMTLPEIEQLIIDAVENGVGKEITEYRKDGFCPSDFWAEPWLILTGGEPSLQVDIPFLEYFKRKGVKIAIETNGSNPLPLTGGYTDQSFLTSYHDVDAALAFFPFDWIVVSPKVAEHAVKQMFAHELRYVRGVGQSIPKPSCKALHKLISPAFDAMRIDSRTIEHCVLMVMENPDWRLSIQSHKLVSGVR